MNFSWYFWKYVVEKLLINNYMLKELMIKFWNKNPLKKTIKGDLMIYQFFMM